MIMDLDDKILDEWVDEKADLRMAIAKQKDFIFFIKLLLESKFLLYVSLHQTRYLDGPWQIDLLLF